MKQIKIKSILMENFKGCTSAAIDFQEVTNIYGANASGKTTVFDAFTWLLFDKDSSGATRFSVRPLGADGNTIDNVEIKVEVVLDIDGKELALQKVQKQNWVKRRGTDVTELQGNLNTYEIDTFPAKESEFKSKVDEIITEDLFKMLTDPRAFASLPWKKQRDILMQFISEIKDADVLATDLKKYEPIADDLGQAPIEKCIEKAKKQMVLLKKSQAELPTRIDEASKSIVEIPDLAELELQKNALNEQLADIDAQRSDSSKITDVVHAIQSDIISAQKEIQSIQENAGNELNASRKAKRDIYEKAQCESVEYKRFSDRKKEECLELLTKMENANKRRNEYTADWKEAKALEFDASSTVCKACGQELPADQAEELKAKFEKAKEEKIEKILVAGRAEKANIEELEEKIKVLQAEEEDFRKKWTESMQKESKAYETLQAVPKEVDLSGNERITELKAEIEKLKAQLANSDTIDKLAEQLKTREQDIRSKLSTVEKELMSVDMNEKLEERIETLKDEQKVVGQQVADQEQKIYLLEEFSRAKMDMLAEGINSKFTIVDFKLFEMQLNGGIKDTCEIMVNGVPYSGLNSASKMQAGLDVINSLAELYEVSAPVWLDNRESVTDIPETNTQIINLYVSPEDKRLRIGA